MSGFFGAGGGGGSSFDATAEGAFALGEIGYLFTAANRVQLANAVADNLASRAVCVASAAIGAGAVGTFYLNGVRAVRLVAGLVLTPGDPIFLSAATAGRGTNVPPVVAGQVQQLVGYLKDPLTYDGVADLNVQIALLPVGPRLVV